MRIVSQNDYNNKYSQRNYIEDTGRLDQQHRKVYVKKYEGLSRVGVTIKAIAEWIFSWGSVQKKESWQERWHAVRYGFKEIAVEDPSVSNSSSSAPVREATPAPPAEKSTKDLLKDSVANVYYHPLLDELDKLDNSQCEEIVRIAQNIASHCNASGSFGYSKISDNVILNARQVHFSKMFMSLFAGIDPQILTRLVYEQLKTQLNDSDRSRLHFSKGTDGHDAIMFDYRDRNAAALGSSANKPPLENPSHELLQTIQGSYLPLFAEIDALDEKQCQEILKDSKNMAYRFERPMQDTLTYIPQMHAHALQKKGMLVSELGISLETLVRLVQAQLKDPSRLHYSKIPAYHAKGSNAHAILYDEV